jgi:hypothetical protein
MLRPLTVFHPKSAMMALRPRPRCATRMTTLRFQHGSGDERLPVLNANMTLKGKAQEGIELSRKNELKTVKFDPRKEVKEVKTELEEVRTELRKDIGSLQTDLEAVQIEVKKDIGSIKTGLEAVEYVVKEVESEVKEVITKLKEVKTDLKEVKTELKKVKTEQKEEDIGSPKTQIFEGILEGIGWCGKHIVLLIAVVLRLAYLISAVGGICGGICLFFLARRRPSHIEINFPTP